MVKVLYFAEFQKITGKNEEFIKLDNKALQNLVKILIQKYPHLKKLIWDNKKETLSDNISIIVNKTIVKHEKFLSTSLSEDDIISFLLPVSGG